jgi:AraC-like DNA-binding protein
MHVSDQPGNAVRSRRAPCRKAVNYSAQDAVEEFLGKRIERARELLRKGMNSGQVASLVGFSDQSHFTRHFKKIMRVTPSAYARGVAARKSYPSALASSSNIV